VLGPAWRRGCSLRAGDRVRVELEPEGPQRQDLVRDLAAALDATKRNPALRAERIAAVVALLERGVKARP
jgi:hypothetical protein